MEEQRRIGWQIKVISNLIKREVGNYCCEKYQDELTGNNMFIIGHLARHRNEDVFQKDLEEIFSVRRSTMSTIILRMEQKGFLVRESVPYDARLKKLVLTEKGETVTEKTECVVSLSYDANLPERYVRSANQRMSLYKRISLIASRYDMSDMTDELLDRYGDLPKAASNLLRIALIRSLAEGCGITQIRQDGADVHICSPALEVDIWMELAARFPGKLRMMLSANPYIRYHIDKKTTALEDLIELFLTYGQIAEEKKRKA